MDQKTKDYLETLSRQFCRAFKLTKEMDTSNYIVSGDYLSGDNFTAKLVDASRIYDLSKDQVNSIIKIQTKFFNLSKDQVGIINIQTKFLRGEL